MMLAGVIRVRFGHVLWSGFLAVLLILVVQGGMAAWSLTHIESRNTEAIENVTRLVEEVRQIQHGLQEAADEVKVLSDDVRTGLSMQMNRGAQDLAILQRAVERLVKSSGESIAELEAMLEDESLDDQMIGIIEDLIFTLEDSEDKARKECLPTVRAVVANLGKGIEAADDTAGRIESLETTMSSFAVTSMAVVEKGDIAQQVTTAGLEEATHAKKLIAGALIVGIIVGSIIPFLIVRRTVCPLRTLIASVRDIAEGEGDLTRRLKMSRSDEIGELAGWFDTFVERIHGIISQVASASAEVAAASTQIAASSEQMSSGLVSQTQQIEQISSAIEEMSSSVVEVARSAADAACDADHAGQAARDGGKLVEDTVESMSEISMAVGCGASSVTELGRKSEQIGAIIDVINDIADQTNLLALNAAIEAARAGEHGRGFAVVADEVRKLAERTTQATEEVAQSIGEIQEETSKAVDLIGSGSRRVDDGVALANRAGHALEQIVSSSQSLAQRVASIATATEEQSSASEEIARGVEHINVVTRQSSEGAGQAAEAATVLSQEAERLRSLIGQFRL